MPRSVDHVPAFYAPIEPLSAETVHAARLQVAGCVPSGEVVGLLEMLGLNSSTPTSSRAER